MITVNQAIDLIVSNVLGPEKINIPLKKAYGFVCAEPIIADRDFPPYNRAAMDGFCLNTADFETGVSQGLEIQFEISAGKEKTEILQPHKAVQIMTGGVVPPGADMVIKIEECEIKNSRVFFKGSNCVKGLNIAKQGEDNLKGNVLINPGLPVNGSVAATAASVGKTMINVYKKPTVSIMTTGNEVIPPASHPAPHQIRDCNTVSCALFCERFGIKANVLGIVPDDKKQLKEAVNEGMKSDILVMSGGISAGKYDFSAEVLKDCGVEVIYHKVMMRPGKPNYFGKSASTKTAVFVLPGNPVSVQTGFKIFVETYIRGFMGFLSPFVPPAYFKINSRIDKDFPLEYYFPVRICDHANRVCTPVKIKSSGDFSNFALADGIAKMYMNKSGFKPNDTIPVILI